MCTFKGQGALLAVGVYSLIFFLIERKLPLASYSQIPESILENVIEAKIKEQGGREEREKWVKMTITIT